MLDRLPARLPDRWMLRGWTFLVFIIASWWGSGACPLGAQVPQPRRDLKPSPWSEGPRCTLGLSQVQGPRAVNSLIEVWEICIPGVSWSSGSVDQMLGSQQYASPGFGVRKGSFL